MCLRATAALLLSLCLAAPAHADRISAVPERPAQAQRNGVPQSCDVPRPALGQRVILVGAYEGDAMSTVALDGQDRETNVTYVDIEPGTQPLYLALTSHKSMVWIFRGATQRVSHVALMALAENNRPSPAGAVGLRPERVSVHPVACFRYFTSADDRQAQVTSDALARATGRPVETVIGMYSATAIALPSGTLTNTLRNEVARAPAGYDARLWANAMRFAPAGLIEINPASVVGARAERYEVYPNQFGLAQLVRSGHLAFEGGFTFRMLRSLPRYPAQLRGAHSVVFIRPGNVSEPPGSPGHSCVVNEATEEAIGPNCRVRLGRRDTRVPVVSAGTH